MSDTIYYPNEAIDTITQVILQTTLFSEYAFEFYAKLFVSNITPSASDTYAGTYAPYLCTVPGYADIDMTGTWTGATAAQISAYAPPTLTWNFTVNTSAQIAYGLVLTTLDRVSTPWLIGVVAFGSPYFIPPTASYFSYNLTWSTTY
jgi:hypothetical protein